jgi:hypothetical protein
MRTVFNYNNKKTGIKFPVVIENAGHIDVDGFTHPQFSINGEFFVDVWGHKPQGLYLAFLIKKGYAQDIPRRKCGLPVSL